MSRAWIAIAGIACLASMAAYRLHGRAIQVAMPHEATSDPGDASHLPVAGLRVVAPPAATQPAATMAADVPVSMAVLAGDGTTGFGGDGGPATAAKLFRPEDVAVDGHGNVYIADVWNNRVRKITPAGTISTVAGGGTWGAPSEYVPATSAFVQVNNIAVDAAGTLYIASGARIRRVGTDGILRTIAGGDTWGNTGDGGPASDARLSSVESLATDAQGNLYATSGPYIRRISTDGLIHTVAGSGRTDGMACVDGPATGVWIAPKDIAADGLGNLFVLEETCIRRITPEGDSRVITRLYSPYLAPEPSRIPVFSTDPDVATIAFAHVEGIAVDGRGGLYLAGRSALRQVSADGIQQWVVANPSAYDFTDRPPLVTAVLNDAVAVDVDDAGNVFVVERGGNRVQRVTPVPDAPIPGSVHAFAPYEILPIAAGTAAVAIGDVTGDGRDDVALTTGTTWPAGPLDSHVLLYVQSANGQLMPPVGVRSAVSLGANRGLALADVDKDGHKDVIVAHGQGLTLYAGTPSGLGEARLVPGLGGTGLSGQPSPAATTVLPMDVNRDGAVDVVAQGYNGFTVYLGAAGGALAAAQWYPVADQGLRPELVAGDLNDDGFLDLVLGLQGPSLAVFLSDRQVGFVATPPIPLAHTPAIGDFNNDGLADLAYTAVTFAPTPMLGLRLQNGGQLSTAAATWRTYAASHAMLAHDMDRDGRQDLVVLHFDRALGYYHQTSQGFDIEAKYLLPRADYGYAVQGMAVGDVDGDTCPDIATANANYGLVLLKGRRCVPSRPLPPTGGPHRREPASAAAAAPPVSALRSRMPRAGTGNAHHHDMTVRGAGRPPAAR